MEFCHEFKMKRQLTAEEIELITDAEFERTPKVIFTTPKGKEVVYIKESLMLEKVDEICKKIYLETDLGRYYTETIKKIITDELEVDNIECKAESKEAEEGACRIKG